MRHELAVLGPLDLPLTFTCGQAFRWRPDGNGWSGIVGGSDLHVSESGPGRLTIRVRGEDPGPEALSRYFRSDEDPRIHLEHAASLREVPGFLPLLGLRLLRQDPWEATASFIASAAANIGKISGCVERLSDRWGRPIAGSPRRAFPEPGSIARARERDLRAIGLGFRAPYLLLAARRIAAASRAGRKPGSPSTWSWERLRSLPIEAARAELASLPGVGPKVADCVLLFGLDRLEAYPLDRWIRRATLELSARRRARDAELQRWATRLGPGRGYLQQLLFHLRRTAGPLPPLR